MTSNLRSMCGAVDFRGARATRNQLAVLATIVIISAPHSARAAAPQAESAEAPAASAAAPASDDALEQVVVTATATAVRKLDASYTITAVNAEQIKMANPKSAADLLKVAPGLWPESTGGQTGANIEVAGFPSGGDSPFFTNQFMGSPIYGSPTLSFFEGTSAIRLDDTVERVEIVQGGPSVVFADGQPGATANYILKRGTDNETGSASVTYGSEQLYRVDTFYGGKLAEGWYGSGGGFYRYSNGIRDPQFPSDNGGQFTATLTHDVDGGSVTAFARVLRDKNQFITPIPLIQQGSDHFSAYPGFNPLTDTYYSKAIQHVYLPTYPGGSGGSADLANGRGADVHFAGFNADFELPGGIKVSDKLLFFGGNMDTNALLSGTNPATLNDELYTVSGSQGGYELPTGSATAFYADNGQPVGANTDVIHQNWAFIHKHLFSVNNDLRLSKEIFPGNTATIGLYTARWTDHDKWSLGNQMLMTNSPNARPITVSYIDPTSGQPFQRLDPQGFDFNGGFDIAEDGGATDVSGYLSDSWRLGPWLFDASGRVEHMNASNSTCNLETVDYDNNPATVYNNTAARCNGTFTTYAYNPTRVPWTFGANYEITDHMSVYARANRGYHYLDFDNGLRDQTSNKVNTWLYTTVPTQSVENQEIGFKYADSLVFADISLYHRAFQGLQYQPTDVNGVQFGDKSIYGSDSEGVNFDVFVTPIQHLKLEVIGNYLAGIYTGNFSCLQFKNSVTGVTGCQPIDGKQLQRQPKFRIAVTPSYTIPLGWGDVTPFLTYRHVGAHTQDQSGLQQLGTYDTLDFGVVANYTEHWELRVQGTNMTNELGLTESNSRIFGAAAGGGGVILARPLEGREVNVTLKYQF
jgi:outer membrane receptor protein involved in Fe transport